MSGIGASILLLVLILHLSLVVYTINSFRKVYTASSFQCDVLMRSGIYDRVLAEKLNLNYEEAERWIVNLIRNSKLDAKIDSKTGTVVMEPNHPNV